MKGLDTNVLVRYLTWDDGDQAERAADLVESAADAGEPLFVGPVVMCELVWVLETAYGLARDTTLDTVESVLRTAQLDFGDKDILWQALADARRGEADFADYVIGRQSTAAGCTTTATFDTKLAESPLFDLL